MMLRSFVFLLGYWCGEAFAICGVDGQGFRGLGAKGVGMGPLCHVSPMLGAMDGHPGAVPG